MLILIFGSKSGFGDDFGQSDTNTIILRRFFGQPLRNNVAQQRLRFQVMNSYLKVCVIR